MNTIVVYRSKSGNTEGIAKIIAKKLGAKALPVNLVSKKGRGTKEEQKKEKELFAVALEACKDADLVIIGTPVSFQKAHSQITRFCKQVEAKRAGVFSTYINKPGSALDDLQVIVQERGVIVVGTIGFGKLNSGQFEKLNESERDKLEAKVHEFVNKITKE